MSHHGQQPAPSLVKFAWLSVAAALITIALKSTAFAITGSVGLLSDALESLVNLAAAAVALITLRIVEQPPDEVHEYGHDKAGYFSSGVEGTLIVVAALGIIWAGGQRLVDPRPVEQAGIGLAIALVAAAVNLVVGRLLIRVGKEHESIALEADGHHLMSDVWTSAGVVVGVAGAALTGLNWLDPLIAILVGLRIGWEGGRILWRTTHGLMDTTIDPGERAQIEAILLKYHDDVGIEWHALRTRQAGARRFVGVHIHVPGDWSVQRAHALANQIEAEIAQAVPNAAATTHIEPLGDITEEHLIAVERHA